MEMGGGGSMSTTAASSSASGSSGGMTMGGMNMGSMGGTGTGTGMQMTFIAAHDTPLFSTALTPTGAGGYAGLCIFLIVLAAVTRGLLAFRTVMERRQLDRDRRRRYVVVRDRPTEAQSVADSDEAKDGTLISARGAEEKVRVLTATTRPVTAWRLSTDVPRALLTTLVAGMGYLLMLAVMTYNVGYFLSVLGGIFLGDLAVGRFTVGGGDH